MLPRRQASTQGRRWVMWATPDPSCGGFVWAHGSADDRHVSPEVYTPISAAIHNAGSRRSDWLWYCDQQLYAYRFRRRPVRRLSVGLAMGGSPPRARRKPPVVSAMPRWPRLPPTWVRPGWNGRGTAKSSLCQVLSYQRGCRSRCVLSLAASAQKVRACSATARFRTDAVQVITCHCRARCSWALVTQFFTEAWWVDPVVSLGVVWVSAPIRGTGMCVRL
jgi:hypothetical protein